MDVYNKSLASVSSCFSQARSLSLSLSLSPPLSLSCLWFRKAEAAYSKYHSWVLMSRPSLCNLIYCTDGVNQRDFRDFEGFVVLDTQKGHTGMNSMNYISFVLNRFACVCLVQ